MCEAVIDKGDPRHAVGSFQQQLERPSSSANKGRQFAVVCAVNFGAMVSFYLLFPVAPLLVARLGGNGAQAGFATGIIMLATIIAEYSSTFLQRRFRGRTLLGLALLLLGAPSALLGFAASPAAVLGISGLRGLGLGLLLVVSATMIAESLPPEKRSAGLSLYGVISGLPAILVLPVGPWMLASLGPWLTTLIGGGAAIFGLPGLLAMPSAMNGNREVTCLTKLLKDPGVVRPAFSLLCVATATGISTSLLPLVQSWATPATIAVGLFAHSIGAVVARGLSGRVSATAAQARMLQAGIALTALGLFALAIAMNGPALVLAMGLLGSGFGLVQNPTFVVLLARAGDGAEGEVSVLWNLAYDAGLGLGAVLFGIVADAIGPSRALFVIAVAILPLIFIMTGSGGSSALKAKTVACLATHG
jgi:predicted MFS family arabinose efflux permease